MLTQVFQASLICRATLYLSVTAAASSPFVRTLFTVRLIIIIIIISMGSGGIHAAHIPNVLYFVIPVKWQ